MIRNTLYQYFECKLVNDEGFFHHLKDDDV